MYRQLVNASILSNADERPYANIKILGQSFFGLLDSGASVSVSFIEANKLKLRPFKCKISTANGSKAPKALRLLIKR